MKPARVNSLVVIGIGTALVLWAGCLLIIWAWALDSSGATALSGLAATFLAIAVTAALPGKFARAAQALLGRRGPQYVLWTELATAEGRTGRDEARAVTRLVAASTAAAVACGLLSTALVLLASLAADGLASAFLWDSPTWWLCKFLLQFLATLPMGLALSVAFLAGTILRGSAGTAAYAPVCRDWLWAIALGSGAFAACRWAGANVAGVTMATAFLLLAAGAGILLRAQPTVRPRGPAETVEVPGATLYLGVAAGFATLCLTLLVQLRLLADLGGAGMTGSACWTAGSFALLALFVGREDAKSRAPSRGQSLGSAIGLAAGLMMQFALAVSCAAAPPGRFVREALLAASQIPLAALWAVVLSRQRRMLASKGGQARQYVAAATGGAGLACLGYVAACWIPGATVALLGLVVMVPIVSALWAMKRSQGRRESMKWATWSTVLVLSAVAGVGGELRRFASAVGTVRPGVWLSELRPADPRNDRPVGLLPSAGTAFRGGAITEAVLSVLEGHPGRWWVFGETGLPAERITPKVRCEPAIADPTARSEDEDGAGAGDPFLVSPNDAGAFDGMLLSPLPADHPEAWRCYNDRMLRRCATRRGPDAVVMLRTHTDARRIGPALAVAETFAEVFGQGWAAVEFGSGRVEFLLIAGPRDLPPRLIGREGLFVVPTERLRERWKVGPIRVLGPIPGWKSRGPDGEELRKWLESSGSAQDEPRANP